MKNIILTCVLILGQWATASVNTPTTTNGCVLRGTVRDPYGAVVSGALVSVREASDLSPNVQGAERGKALATVKTNESGQYFLELAEGLYQLCVMHKDFVSNCRIVRTKDGQVVANDFSLAIDPDAARADQPADVEILDRRLKTLAGNGAIDCGHALVNQKPETNTSCALNAIHKHKAFHVRYDAKGIDAQLSDGLAVDSDGNGYAVIFDSLGLSEESLSKEATMPDGSRTAVLACPKPLKIRKTTNGRLSCFKSSQQFFWNN